MRNVTLCFTFLILIFSFAKGQVSYDPGYIVLENGQRLEVWIQNKEKHLTPVAIKYRESAKAKPQELDSKEVKEFGVGTYLRFIKATVRIDRSTHKEHMVGNNRNPEWEENTVFLQLLVEGEASLYYYRDRKNIALFVQKDQGAIDQLIYKPYRDTEAQLRYNTYYRNQLTFLLDCKNMQAKPLEKLLYSKSEMIHYFKAYNACKGVNINDYTQKPKRDFFNMYVVGSYRIAQFQTLSSNPNLPTYRRLDFGRKAIIPLGLDMEYVFPFNRNKWSVFITPVYQRFSGETINDNDPASADYRSVEVPIGIRRYFFLHPDHKIYGALAYQFDVETGSKGVDLPASNQEGLSLEPITYNWMLGAGYRYKHFLSLEGRIQSGRNVRLGYWNWNIIYRSRAEIMLGIGIF